MQSDAFCVSSCHQPKGLRRDSVHVKDIDAPPGVIHTQRLCSMEIFRPRELYFSAFPSSRNSVNAWQ